MREMMERMGDKQEATGVLEDEEFQRLQPEKEGITNLKAEEVEPGLMEISYDFTDVSLVHQYSDEEEENGLPVPVIKMKKRSFEYILPIENSENPEDSIENIQGVTQLLTNILFTFEFEDKEIKKVKSSSKYERPDKHTVTFRWAPEQMKEKEDFSLKLKLK